MKNYSIPAFVFLLILGLVSLHTLNVAAVLPRPVVCALSDTVGPTRPFEGHFYCSETGVNIYLDLYDENMEVPGFEFLGKMAGYMRGDIYGTWMLISHAVKGKKALLRFSNDIGSDSQNIEFTQVSDSVYTYHAVGGNEIRKASGRKLVKVSGEMNFKRK